MLYVSACNLYNEIKFKPNPYIDWGKATRINISSSNGDLICQRNHIGVRKHIYKRIKFTDVCNFTIFFFFFFC